MNIEEFREYCLSIKGNFKTPKWNLVTLESDVPDELIRDLIQHSVDEVIKKLPKKKREEYLRL